MHSRLLRSETSRAEGNIKTPENNIVRSTYFATPLCHIAGPRATGSQPSGVTRLTYRSKHIRYRGLHHSGTAVSQVFVSVTRQNVVIVLATCVFSHPAQESFLVLEQLCLVHLCSRMNRRHRQSTFLVTRANQRAQLVAFNDEPACIIRPCRQRPGCRARMTEPSC